MKRLLFVGEAMAELRLGEQGFVVGYAGDTFNTAVYCQRSLKEPLLVSYLSRIGTDPLSDGFLSLAKKEKLQSDMIRRDPKYNIGIYSVTTDEAGERSFNYWRNNSAARQLFSDPIDFVALEKAQLIYLSGITLAIISPSARETLLDKLTRLRNERNVRIAFDSNYRPQLWTSLSEAQHWISLFWKITDIALPSVDDELALFKDTNSHEVLERLRSWGCNFGALKCGAAGPLPIDKKTPLLMGLEQVVRVVDTTAAGDSFNGAFLAAYMTGQDVGIAMRNGHQMAAKVIQQPGAIINNEGCLA